MTQAALASGSNSVLIVDNSEENREVLRTVLESRGVRILEAGRAAQGLEILRTRHPRVVILDLEAEQTENDELQAAYEDESQENGISLVFLGRMPGRSHPQATSPGRRAIEKPYHYAPLIRTIEQLLARR